MPNTISSKDNEVINRDIADLIYRNSEGLVSDEEVDRAINDILRHNFKQSLLRNICVQLFPSLSNSAKKK